MHGDQQRDQSDQDPYGAGNDAVLDPIFFSRPGAADEDGGRDLDNDGEKRNRAENAEGEGGAAKGGEIAGQHGAAAGDRGEQGPQHGAKHEVTKTFYSGSRNPALPVKRAHGRTQFSKQRHLHALLCGPARTKADQHIHSRTMVHFPFIF